MGVGLVQGQASIGVHVKSGAMGEVSFSMGGCLSPCWAAKA